MKRRGIAFNCNALSGFVVMFHSDDYISLFVPFVDIPVSVSSLFQGIASINDRFYLSRLNRTFREDVLDAFLFNSLQEVREITEQWIEEYNAIRPHDALEGLPPYQHAVAKP
jgi:hypothetical protein